MIEKKFTVGGMTCSACSARVERCVGKIDGVESVAVNLISGIMSVRSEKDVTDAIIKSVKAEGYTVKEGSDQRRGREKERSLIRRLFVSLPLVILLAYLSMGYMLYADHGVAAIPPFLREKTVLAAAEMLLATPVLAVNYSYFTSGFKKLFALAPNMDTLVALGSSVSYAYSVYTAVLIFTGGGSVAGLFFEGAAMILAFVTIGKFLEEKSKNKTMGAVEKLLDLAPEVAVVMRDGKETEINAAALKKGDTVVMKEGFSAPCDGIITEGEGWADEALITGESVPVYKTVGDSVLSASVNKNGTLKFRAEKSARTLRFQK